VLDALVKKGMPRFDAYRTIQRIAFDATKKGIHFLDALIKDKEISSVLNSNELKTVFNPKNHLSASGKIIGNMAKIVRNACK
jgi:adenylosuccinate lyase